MTALLSFDDLYGRPVLTRLSLSCRCVRKNARQTLEDFVLSYFPLYGLQLPQVTVKITSHGATAALQAFLRYCHVFTYVEGMLYQLDRQNERSCREGHPKSTSPSPSRCSGAHLHRVCAQISMLFESF